MANVGDVPRRWTQATVYPDVWSDPDEDPRENASVTPIGLAARCRVGGPPSTRHPHAGRSA